MNSPNTHTATSATALARVMPSAVQARVERWYGDTDESKQPVIALRGAPVWDGEQSVSVEGRAVPVYTAESVLGVLDAIDACDGQPLVLITSLELSDLKESVCARLYKNEIRSVDHWETVKILAGVGRIEQVLRDGDYDWLAEAAVGAGKILWENKWGKPGELRRDTLLTRLAAYRLGRAPETGVDAAALLEWSHRYRWDDTWGRLPEAEQAGLVEFLATPGVIGPSARMIIGLAQQHFKVLPTGLAARELYAEGRAVGEGVRGRFEGRYFFEFSSTPTPAEMRVFGEECDAFVRRWNEPGSIAAVENATEGLLSELQAEQLAADSAWLRVGLDTAIDRFAAAAKRATAELVRAESVPAARVANARKRVEDSLLAAEDAYEALSKHQRVTDEDRSAPLAALRLLRWLSLEHRPIGDLAEGLHRHLAEGGWVDRACSVLHTEDTTYGEAVFAQARACRRRIDREFAAHLAAFGGRKRTGSELLCIEDVLEAVVEPIAKVSVPPLLLVADGMSAADAASLAEGVVAEHAWYEVVPSGEAASGLAEHRRAALAAMPSETRYSRTSLLSGEFSGGGQSTEDQGFKRFWSRYNRHGSAVFHKDDLRPRSGSGLPEPVREAVADTRGVVAAVLNQIDDALDKDQRLADPEWQFDSLDQARALLDEAARAGRPVILCSDHGNIRDWTSRRRTTEQSISEQGVAGGGDGEKRGRSEHPRWRPGDDAGEGEIVLSGGRLSVPGPVCLAVDEDLRYTSRRAGYHGGASLAEATVPVLVFLPSGAAEPKGWTKIGSAVQPAWWRGRVDDLLRAVPSAPEPGEGLFARDAARIGAQVVASRRYEARKSFVKRVPEQVAQLIDSLEDANWEMPMSALALRLGMSETRCKSMLSPVKRLLNEPGAEVLVIGDGGQTVSINESLLRTQFLGG